MRRITFFALFQIILVLQTLGQSASINQYDVIWNSQSQNSSESMPCGGGDIGLNVWVENGDILFYISKSGFFDENNGFLKAGRVRLKLSPNPFDGGTFKQELKLEQGLVQIDGFKYGLKVQVQIWVDVFHPVIHVEAIANRKITLEAGFESWRSVDREIRDTEGFANSYKWGVPKGLKTLKDEISFENGSVLFVHRNKELTVFDATVKQQDLEAVKDQLFNPLKNLTFGGQMMGRNMVPSGNYEGKYLDTEYKGWLLKSKSAEKKTNC